MKLKDIRPLTYDTRLIGLRFTLTNERVLDADKPSLIKKGILNINLPNQVALIQHEGILISEEELSQGVVAEDISEDEEKLSILVDYLKQQDSYQHLFSFQKPYEQSLKTFMEDDFWEPVKVDRTDEHKNQHSIYQPDGRKYSGGWIGSARSLNAAKSNFHQDQVRWALHRGSYVSEEALETYPDLKQYSDFIAQIKQIVKVETHENGITTFQLIEPNKTTSALNIEDYPHNNRINQRGFVSEHNLTPNLFNGITLLDNFLDPRELTIIAISQAIHEHQNKTIKDPYYENRVINKSKHKNINDYYNTY